MTPFPNNQAVADLTPRPERALWGVRRGGPSLPGDRLLGQFWSER